MTPILNHIISFANVPSIDRHLERYRKAGFSVNLKTVRHAPGRRNGFIDFGPDYLEFFWIEDQRAFDKKGMSQHKYFQHSPRPFGIAWESKNVAAFHKKAIRKGFRLPATWSKALMDSGDAKPWWAFQDVPQRCLPGVWSFMLTYLRRDWLQPQKVSIGKNGIYGLVGITFISSRPDERAVQWQKFLGGNVQEPARLVLGPHVLEWMTPKEYANTYGAVRSPIQSKKFKNMQEISLIHLVAKDVRKARRMLVQNQFRVADHTNGFFITPDVRDGFAFLVTEMSPQAWAKTRRSHRPVVISKI